MLGNNRGFTLIEVMVYLALFSVLMTGLVVTAYAVTSSTGAAREAALVATEASFVQEKLAWDLTYEKSLSMIALDPAHHAITEHDAPLTSANVVVSSLTITPTPGAYDVSFVMNGELFSERYYLP